MILVNILAIRDAAKYRPSGYEEEMLSAGVVDGDYVQIADDAYDALFLKYIGSIRPCGPGCQLKRILEAWGFVAQPGCKCEARAATMDAWGPDECATPDRAKEILGWLKEEADARGLPFISTVASLGVKRAIWLARKNAKAVAAAQSPPS
jgi:hypothetical protein